MSSTRSTMRRIAVGAALGLLGIYASAFGTAWLQAKGWLDNPTAKTAAVTGFLGALVASPWFHWISGIVIGFAAGAWLDAYLIRRSAVRWWEKIQAFSIRDAACLLAGVEPQKFDGSQQAKAIAHEIKGYVDSGHMPTFLELQNPRMLNDPALNYAPPYDKKAVDFSATVPKRSLEDLARGRGWDLPWPIPSKRGQGASPRFRQPPEP